MSRAAQADRQQADTCRECGGKGAVIYGSRPGSKAPAYWFEKGAQTCPDCDGTGEQ